MTKFDKQILSSFLFYVGLTLLFTAAKFIGIIGWAWLWVFSPMWIPVALTIALAIVSLIYYLVVLNK